MTRRLSLAGAALLAAFLSGAPASAGTICDRPHVAGAPHVVMLLWRGPTEVERGFLAHVEARGMALNVTCLSADRNAANLPDMVARARALAPDLVYTWGTGVTLAAVGRADRVDPEVHITDRPVLFTMVAYPVESGLVPSFAEPGRNVTGATHTVPLLAQLRAMRAYRPVSSIGVIFNPLEVNSIINVQQLTETAEAEGIEVIALPVLLDAAGLPDPSSLSLLVARLAARQPQFLFIGPDSFIGEHREAVIGAALASGLPAFTGTELEIAEGSAMLGLVTSYYNLGRYMGSLVEQVLFEGLDPRDIPVRTLSRFTFMVRLPVAQRLGLYPPLEVLDFAQILLEPPP
jgi:putative tryptophan/tyrosine transport system substrate-binding protein